MTRMNISLDEETMKQLREIADRENRPISKQIKQMMEYYIQHTQK